MSNTKGVAQAALAGIMALSMLGVVEKASAADAPKYERCYGIAAAGKNDCGTGVTSCSGTVKVDKACYAWINTPKGLCAKIAGSSVAKPADGCMLPNGKPAKVS
jgi:uncharacterized membrane protein